MGLHNVGSRRGQRTEAKCTAGDGVRRAHSGGHLSRHEHDVRLCASVKRSGEIRNDRAYRGRNAVLTSSRSMALPHDRHLLLQCRRIVHPLRLARIHGDGTGRSLFSKHGADPSPVAHTRFQPDRPGYLGSRLNNQREVRLALHIRDLRHDVFLRPHGRRIVRPAMETTRCRPSLPLHRLSVASGNLPAYRDRLARQHNYHQAERSAG